MQLNQPALSVTPRPPSLHWAIVLGLSIVTLNLFGLIWMIRQAVFVRKIDPPNRAAYQLMVSLLFQVVLALFSAMNAITLAKTGQGTDLGIVTNLMQGVSFVLFITAAFQIRAALMKYYGIKLNNFLTFFFNTYYFQYHLSKIAKAQNVSFVGTAPSTQTRSASA